MECFPPSMIWKKTCPWERVSQSDFKLCYKRLYLLDYFLIMQIKWKNDQCFNIKLTKFSSHFECYKYYLNLTGVLKFAFNFFIFFFCVISRIKSTELILLFYNNLKLNFVIKLDQESIAITIVLSI